jgi:hypothetical protein
MNLLTSIEGFLVKEEHAIAAEISKLSGGAKVALHIGVAVVDELNAIVQNPVVDIAASLTGSLGTTIVTDLKAILPQVAADLQLGETILGSTDPNVILNAIVSVIQDKVGIAKNLDLHGLALIISTDISKGALTWSDAAQLEEWYYKNAYTAVKSAS